LAYAPPTGADPGADVEPVRHLSLDEIRAADVRYDAMAASGHPVSALRPGVQSLNRTAIVGIDGYLFIGKGSNDWERQYLGEFALDPSWFAAWRRVYAARQAEAARRGITLWNFVAPEKQVIYADKRWPAGGVSGAKRPFVQLLAEMGPEARIVYPEAELTAARQISPAFVRHNSHWTSSGCCAAAGALMRALEPAADWKTLRFAHRQIRGAQDLTSHFFQPPPEEDAGWLALNGEIVFDNQVFQKTGRLSGSRYATRNAAAPDPRSLLVFGDSFSYDAGLAGFLSTVFRAVTFIWSKDVLWNEVDEYAPDIVIAESAERFFSTLAKS